MIIISLFCIDLQLEDVVILQPNRANEEGKAGDYLIAGNLCSRLKGGVVSPFS